MFNDVLRRVPQPCVGTNHTTNLRGFKYELGAMKVTGIQLMSRWWYINIRAYIDMESDPSLNIPNQGGWRCIRTLIKIFRNLPSICLNLEKYEN